MEQYLCRDSLLQRYAQVWISEAGHLRKLRRLRRPQVLEKMRAFVPTLKMQGSEIRVAEEDRKNRIFSEPNSELFGSNSSGFGGYCCELGIRHLQLPTHYVRSASDRPRWDEVVSDEIPWIDLGDADRSDIISQIGHACRNYGFFQVTNHGISEELLLKMIETAREFFHMPVAEKMKYYSDDPLKKMRLSTSFNLGKEKVRNWRDYLRLHCHPLEEYVDEWPSSPPFFKDVVSAYCKEVRQLAFRLQEAICESLGLEGDYINKVLGDQGQHMAINYYPPCPEPDLTFGLPGHCDSNTITILLQDVQVAGLQVLKSGKWVAVDPLPNALVINIGDQMQALSNGRYKSLRHRAIVNSDIERISVASFICPEYSAVVRPAEKLVDDETPAAYRSYTYDEYYKKFWSRSLDDEQCLEQYFKI